jgi:hypothetical protein
MMRAMSLHLGAALLASALLSMLGGSQAQAGSATIGGMKMSCAAAKVVVSNQVPGPGFAVQGLIMFGPRSLSAYPPIVQRRCTMGG